jgi:hypothetical protein
MSSPEHTQPPTIPQSVAEEESVRPANDAIRDVLRAQSGRDRDQGGQTAASESTPQQNTQPQESQESPESEQEAAPRKRTATSKTNDDSE